MNKKIAFGTDGVRGKSNKHPFTDKSLKCLGIAIAKWSTSKYKKNNPKVLLGCDTRVSAQRIKVSLKKGLKTLPLEIVDSGIIPTPGVCVLAQNYQNFDFGIIISASHNPYNDNGIKLIDAKTLKLNKTDEDLISHSFEKITEKELQNLVIDKNAKEIKWNDAALIYQNHIKKFFKKSALTGIKVMLDCANGATYKIAPQIFKSLGIEIKTIATKPNGKNINKNCGALHPKKLQKLVLRNKAVVGFAFDGDGDRLIAVNKNGQIKDGDDLLALLSNHPKLTTSKTIVGTIMTNLGLEQYLKQENKNLIRTSVGDKYVAAKLEENNFYLGGENSGHIIMRDYLNTGDGIFNALRVLEAIILTKNWELNVFEKKPQVNLNIPVNSKKNLSQNPYATIIKNHNNLLHDGRIIVRYSGTENLLRIMVEEENQKSALNIANKLAKKLQEALQ